MTCVRRAISVFLLWSLWYVNANAQAFIAKMEHFGVHQGLSDQNVTAMAQDSGGVLWIGTQDGLNRFDGFEITEFNTQNSDLHASTISYMHMAPDGHLYVYTSKTIIPLNVARVQCIDPVTLKFHDPDTQYMRFVQNVHVGKLYYRDGKMYVFQPDSLRTFDFQNGEKTYKSLPEGVVWQRRLGHFLVGSDLSEHFKLTDILQPEQLIDTSGAHLPVIRLLNNLNWRTAEYYEDAIRNVIWYHAREKLFGLGSGDQNATFADGDSSLDFSRTISAVIPGHRLIVGTDNGFYILSIDKNRFRNYFVGDEFEGKKWRKGCRGLVRCGDSLYVCMDDAIFECAMSSPDVVRKVAQFHRPRCIVSLNPQEFLIGDLNIERYNTRSRALTDAVIIENNQSSIWGMNLIGDMLYVSNAAGMVATSLSDSTQRVDMQRMRQIRPRESTQCYQFEPLNADQLLLVTSAGLFRSSRDLTDLRRLSVFLADGSPALFSHFTHILHENDGMYWATSLDGALIRFTLSDTIAKVNKWLSRADGVPTNTFYSVYADQYGYLWSSTDLGILRLDTANWAFQFYSEEDGIKNSEFNRLSHYQDETGDLYFGGLDAVTVLTPGEFYTQQSLSLQLRILHLEQYSGWEGRVMDRTEDVKKTGTIVLSPGDNFFTLSVGLGDLFQTDQHQYEYRLSKIDQNWIPCQGNRLRIHGLPYGQQTLEIRGKNARGTPAARILSIPIIVKRPLYLRWWFIALTLGGILLIIREYWLSRTRRIQAEAVKLERLVAERTATINEQASALKKLQESRSQFFANISHELRTPLTLIKGPIESLLRAKTDKADVLDRYAEIILNNTRMLNERIDDLLTLSQADANQLKLNRDSVHLDAFLVQFLESVRDLADQGGINLSYKNSLPASTVVIIDRKKLQHILLNFITNAIKYAGPGSTAMLEAQRDTDRLIFVIRDNGPGISEDNLTKIFDRYYQLGKSTGVGLGLALSKELAEVMSGSVWAESTLGEGSAFFIAIPYEPADMADDTIAIPPVAPEVHAEDASPASTGVMHAARILCVEDNPSLRMYLVNELQKYKVETCANGVEALAILDRAYENSSLPDCILSDVMMPEMDGFELLRRLKESGRYNTIPVIMLTARVGTEDKLAALRIGVDDYLTKPFSSEELMLRIDHLVGRIGMRRDEEATPAAPQVDQAWLQRLEEVIAKRMRESNLTMEQIAGDLHLSRSHFFRMLKANTGMTPNMYLREVRLFKARDLIDEGRVRSVKELSAAVGFDSPPYFSRLFFERFGYKPSDRL